MGMSTENVYIMDYIRIWEEIRTSVSNGLNKLLDFATRTFRDRIASNVVMSFGFRAFVCDSVLNNTLFPKGTASQ